MTQFKTILVALTAWLALTAAAAAHASLWSTEPAGGAMVEVAPTTFSLSFSEPVSPLRLQLIAPDGSATALTGYELRDQTVIIEAPDEIGNGTHVLTWRVVSADGHPVGGSVVFSVGEPSASPPPAIEVEDPSVATALWLSKIALYVGLFIGVGGALAIVALFPTSHPAWRAIAAALAVGMVGTILSAGLQGLDALGAPLGLIADPTMWSTGMATSYGWTVIGATAAMVAAGLSLAINARIPALIFASLALVGAGAALAASGHASAAAPQWLTRPAVFVHAVTIALWAGALIPLAAAFRSGTPDALVALRRFSSAIPLALILLISAGIALAIVQVETPSALLSTSYGRILSAKLGLVAMLLVLAAWNRWRLTARAASNDAAKRSLVRSIAAETVIVLVILALAAGWRFTPPPRALAEAAAQPASIHIHTADAMADLVVTPGRVGVVDVSAIIMTGDFGPLEAKEVTFVFANPTAGIEPFRRAATRPGDGSWRADGVMLPLPGAWSVRIDILVSDFELIRLNGEITIRP